MEREKLRKIRNASIIFSSSFLLSGCQSLQNPDGGLKPEVLLGAAIFVGIPLARKAHKRYNRENPVPADLEASQEIINTVNTTSRLVAAANEARTNAERSEALLEITIGEALRKSNDPTVVAHLIRNTGFDITDQQAKEWAQNAKREYRKQNGPLRILRR